HRGPPLRSAPAPRSHERIAPIIPPIPRALPAWLFDQPGRGAPFLLAWRVARLQRSGPWLFRGIDRSDRVAFARCRRGRDKPRSLRAAKPRAAPVLLRRPDAVIRFPLLDGSVRPQRPTSLTGKEP